MAVDPGRSKAYVKVERPFGGAGLLLKGEMLPLAVEADPICISRRLATSRPGRPSPNAVEVGGHYTTV